MKKVYKFPFKTSDNFAKNMPAYASILSIQMQNGIPCIWALVESEPYHPLETRRFSIYGTGHSIPNSDNELYIATYQEGVFVWHVFEIIK